MTSKNPTTQEMVAILGSMRVGDTLKIGETGVGFFYPPKKVQPYKIKRVRNDRKPRPHHMGITPYTPDQLEQLYFSDTRVISLCTHCDHCETIDVEQLNELAAKHKGKKVVIALGCNNCGNMENALVLTTAIQSLQTLNEQYAPLYDRRNREGR